jgi:NitT/TauT family transport system substrate-binding protein
MATISRRQFTAALGTTALGMVTAACGTSGKPSHGAGSAAPIRTVRVADFQITSMAGSYIAAEKGYFQKEGIKAEFVPMAIADQMPALLSGSVDAFGIGIGAALYNAFSQGIGATMFADHGTSLKDASSNGWIVRKDLVDSGRYRGPADAKGLKVALSLPGSVVEIDLERYLAQGGHTLKDITYANLNLPDIIPAFTGKSLDAAYSLEPFTTIALQKGLVVRGPTGYDLYPGHQNGALTFSEKVSAERDVVLRYLRAYVRGVRDYVKAIIRKDAATFDEISQILVAHTTVKNPAMFRQAMPSGLNADPVLNTSSIVDDLAWMVRNGRVQKSFDLHKNVDTILVRQAIREVGAAG